jgi:hypothetical protein
MKTELLSSFITFLVTLAMVVGVEVLLYKLQSIGMIVLPALVYLLIMLGIIPRGNSRQIALSAGLVAGTILSFALFRLSLP